jgi:hypothetical protein
MRSLHDLTERLWTLFGLKRPSRLVLYMHFLDQFTVSVIVPADLVTVVPELTSTTIE